MRAGREQVAEQLLLVRPLNGPRVCHNERDWRERRDGRDEVRTQSVYAAPFSHVSRFTRCGP